MKVSLQKDLSAALTALKGRSRFYAQGHLPAEGFEIRVGQSAPLRFPLKSPQFKAIKSLATRAPYGRGAQTLVDTNVRRVWQVTPEQVVIRGIEPTIKTIISEMRREMAVQTQVEAQFYKVLIYEEGDFFVEHRDSEKQDGMFGTLIISLPSSFSGGRLKIRHGEEAQSFELSSRSELSWVAFYADCLHEIEPIESGHRVALVYNLIRAGKRGSQNEAAEVASQPSLERVFEDWRGEKSSARLAILLDHHYSNASLSLEALKGEDQSTVRELTQIAQKLNLGAALGILSRKEEGYGYGEEFYSGSRYGGSRYWDDEDEDNDDYEDDVDEGDFTIEEVTDFQTSVNNLIPLTAGEIQASEVELAADEFFPAEIFETLEPDKMSFEEATGNEGGSFERSYRRACLLLWPLEKASEMVLAASPEALLQFILKLRPKSGQSPAEFNHYRLALFERLIEQIKQRSKSYDHQRKLIDSLDWPGLTEALRSTDNPALSLECATACDALLPHWPENALRSLAHLISQASFDPLITLLHGLSSRLGYYKPLHALYAELLDCAPKSVALKILGFYEKLIRESFKAPENSVLSSWTKSRMEEALRHIPIHSILRLCETERRLALLRFLSGSGFYLLEFAEFLSKSSDFSDLDSRDSIVYDWTLARLDEDLSRALDAPKTFARSTGVMKESAGYLCKLFMDFMKSETESRLRVAASEKDRKRLLSDISSAGVIDVRSELERSTRPFALIFVKTSETYTQALARRAALQKVREELSAKARRLDRQKGRGGEATEEAVAKSGEKSRSRQDAESPARKSALPELGEVLSLQQLLSFGLTAKGVQRWLASGIVSEVEDGYKLSDVAVQTIRAISQ